MLRNGEGPLDPVPETALIHQMAKPIRSSVNDTRKFDAVDARTSQMPNDVHQSLRLGSSNSEPKSWLIAPAGLMATAVAYVEYKTGGVGSIWVKVPLGARRKQ